jgi:hypothetical protein
MVDEIFIISTIWDKKSREKFAIRNFAKNICNLLFSNINYTRVPLVNGKRISYLLLAHSLFEGKT